MGLSKSPKSLDQRVQENADIKAQKKRERRLEQKRNYYHASQETKRAAAEQKAQLEKTEKWVESGVWRERAYLLLPGEIAPNRDAKNLTEAEAVCERWLIALGMKHQTETIADREKRIFEEHQKRGCPFLSALNNYLVDQFGDPWKSDSNLGMPETTFEACWELLPGAETTQASMPDISGLPKLSSYGAPPIILPPTSLEREQAAALRQEIENGLAEFTEAERKLHNKPTAIFSTEIL